MATGCKKDEKTVDYKGLLPGEWHCTAVEFGADVYASFEEDGDFDLYQMLGEGRYRHYTGSWSIKGDILSGTYSDGAVWGSSYKMSFTCRVFTIHYPEITSCKLTYFFRLHIINIH